MTRIFFFFLTEASGSWLVLPKEEHWDLAIWMEDPLFLDIKIEITISHTSRDGEPADNQFWNWAENLDEGI